MILQHKNFLYKFLERPFLHIFFHSVDFSGFSTLFFFHFQDLGYESRVSNFQLTTENSIHMLWIVPQYFVITAGEIMFSVTGLEFSYSQSPESMKSVLQAAW